MEEANPTEPTAQQNPKPKKSNAWLYIIIAVVIVGIAGGAWYYYGKAPAVEDTPPTLSLGGGQFQGRAVENTYGFWSYDADDAAAYQEAAGAKYVQVSKGVNFFHVDPSRTYGAAEASFKPTDGLKVFLAYYDFSDSKFHVWPEGPYINTEKEDLNYEVKSFLGTVLISNKGLEVDKNVLIPANEFADKYFVPVPATGTGWVLHPAVADMETALKASEKRIDAIWAQTPDINEFKKITLETIPDDARMFWVKYKVAPPEPYTAP